MSGWFENPEEIRILLNLTQVKGVGGASIRALIERFKSPKEICRANIKALTTVPRVTSEIAQAVKNAQTMTFGDQQLATAEKLKVKILAYWTPAYPDLLRRIPDPPVVLFVNGDLEKLNGFNIAIVGTRSPTVYGKRVTEKLAKDLVAEGALIISGLARGVDAAAHIQTLKSGGRTVAILGTGLDILYPPENSAIAEKIVRSGALISEFPFGTKPDATNFPRRNRIISGMSLGVIVVEARERSGALITAHLALEQNREVFSIPGSIFSAQSAGTHALLKEGAKCVTHIGDILEELPKQGELFARQELTENTMLSMSPQEKEIFRKLSREPLHIDALSRSSGKTPSELLSILLQLEFSGAVKQLPGKMFVRDV